ncbi:MAG: c-type cytochrome [Magnetococcales bacterium]|nr:c-type cytochrome [Magnetococcales bacterium]
MKCRSNPPYMAALFWIALWIPLPVAAEMQTPPPAPVKHETDRTDHKPDDIPASTDLKTENIPARTDHEAGRKIYNFRCYFCHGYSGDARTLAATYLDPKPRNFIATPPETLPFERMVQIITHGRPGTAMAGFQSILTPVEILLVAQFVHQEFLLDRATNTRYHTPENGWERHERYQAAFPFATGRLPIDADDGELTPEQIQGKRLFLATCITCHDRAAVREDGPVWEPRAVSYPRGGYSHRAPPPPLDAVAQATPYAKHDIPPHFPELTPRERQGEKLYQDNCAFCHAADGTGQNWIGTFLEPHPRNLTNPDFMATMTRTRLAETIRHGLPDTSMPAWNAVLDESAIQAIVDYISKAFGTVLQ